MIKIARHKFLKIMTANAAVFAAGALAGPALAEKPGGILHVLHRDSPPSMSIHEEATISTSMPMMGVFNNLVMFDPKEKQNKLTNIVPDLAESWSWNADKTKLTFKLRQGVTWHDGKPFTAKDVQCTWNKLIGEGPRRFSQKSARVLVHEPRQRQHQRRQRGDLQPEATAALIPRPACLRIFAGLSLPCVHQRHANASDRHRTIQVRGIQSQRIHQSGEEPELLEARPAVP